jgi:hypothetical protein
MARPLPANSEYERELFARAAAWDGTDVSVEGVRRVAAADGIDFATALVYDRVRRSPRHAAFIERLEALPPTVPPGCRLGATVVIVPGAFYREFPNSGADGRLLREEAARFGCRTELVPLPSFGPPRDAARILCDWLAKRPAGERLILVSLSKAGGEVKLALAEPGAPELFGNVVAWVNLCGLLNGTPLADWVLAGRLRSWWFRFFLWTRGHDFAVVRELRRGPGTPLAGELVLPPHLCLLSVVGFPLRHHLSNRLARRCHGRLSPLGPNDAAGVLLADALAMPGLVYPLWGTDHYLKPAGYDVRGLAVRILHYLRETSIPKPRGSKTRPAAWG